MGNQRCCPLNRCPLNRCRSGTLSQARSSTSTVSGGWIQRAGAQSRPGWVPVCVRAGVATGAWTRGTPAAVGVDDCVASVRRERAGALAWRGVSCAEE